MQWWSKILGHLKVSEIIEDHIRQGINILLAKGTTGKRCVLPQTTNRFKANLSSVFEFAKDKYHLKTNPCRFIKSKPESKGRKRYLSFEEQKRLVVASQHSSWNKLYLIILMALTTGARRGELEKLSWRDIDWQSAQAICKDTKNSTDKLLHLTPAVLLELKKHREIGQSLIFSHPKRLLSPYDFRHEWTEALLLADIDLINDKGEKLVFHSLRHTFCSSLAKKGVKLHEMAKLAGHKSIQTTMRYTHLDNEHLASVVSDAFSQLGVAFISE